MVHFLPILRPHTDPSLGDCSYLNTCHRMDTCRYMHWFLETPTAQPVPADEAEAAEAAEDEVSQARLDRARPVV